MEEKSKSSHPSDKSMEHHAIVMEEFKSPDPINPSEKSMEDQVIAMEESKFSDPINPRDKNMEDQVIVKEESKFSDPINPRYMMNERHKTFEQIVVTAMKLFLLLIIFVAMNNNISYFGKLIAKYDISVILLLIALVLYFQWKLMSIRVNYLHISNNNYDNNWEIFYFLLLTSVISTLEVSLVSWIAAIITFILWSITLVCYIVISLVDIPPVMQVLVMSCCVFSIAASFEYTMIQSAVPDSCLFRRKCTKIV